MADKVGNEQGLLLQGSSEAKHPIDANRGILFMAGLDGQYRFALIQAG